MGKKPKYHSFVEEGIRYMECSLCGCFVNNIGETTKSVVCSACLAKKALTAWDPLKQNQYVKTGRPPGWQWMKEFVDQDGNVFHKGKEILKLKGTLSPTKIKKKTKKKRKVKKSYETKINALATEYKKKQKLKKETQVGINK